MDYSEIFAVTKVKGGGEYRLEDISAGTGRQFVVKKHPVTGYWQIFEHGRKITWKSETDFYPRVKAYEALVEIVYQGKPETKEEVPDRWYSRQQVRGDKQRRTRDYTRVGPPPPTQIVQVIFKKIADNQWSGLVGTRIFHLWRDEEGWWYGREEGFRNFATRMESRKAAEWELQYWLDADNP